MYGPAALPNPASTRYTAFSLNAGRCGMVAVIGGVVALASVFGFAVRQQREGKES